MVEIDSVATIIDTETVRMICLNSCYPQIRKDTGVARQEPSSLLLLIVQRELVIDQQGVINQQGRASSVLLDFDRPCGVRTNRTGNDSNLKGFNGV